MSSDTSPGVSPKIHENAKEESLFDPDTKDSGFCEDRQEAVDVLLESPYQLQDEASVCFSPCKGVLQLTPSHKQEGSKKRLFVNPVDTTSSPSVATANSFKRLKLIDNLTTENENTEDFPQDFSDKILLEIYDYDVIKSTPRKAREICCTDAQKGFIKEAVEKSSGGNNLIGDFSKDYALPLINGSHPELKSISVDTMRDILDGKYENVIDSFKIIDSRYPYEYEGGHIRGAINLYSKDSSLKLLDIPLTPKDERHILIFHCEFSQERGPNMIRSLREQDRVRNAINYPALNFPEVYVLEGGYKKFFENHPDYCEPNMYKPMLHPEHSDDLKFFRKKSKTSENILKTNKKTPRCNNGLVRKSLSNRFF